MNGLAALPVALPLLVAAVLVGLAPLCPRRIADATAIATAALCTLAGGWLAVRATDGLVAVWFGGWAPRGPVALGITFAIDSWGAAMATLAAGLTTAALVFSWHYFEAVRTYYHALMLLFLAGMEGFALTGDLFNQFMFFELMGVAAYALTAYKVEEVSALEGAVNFAVVNSLGAFLLLIGIALLYGRTGALNLAQIGETLAHGPASPLTGVALTLIVAGFFVKAAVVPFHFWLADAHAVAPAPVCVLFSGVMIELGLFGMLRVFAAVFHGVPGIEEERLRVALAVLGAVTTLGGALMCFAQRHFKRMLAFSSIAHVGMILLGIATLTAKGLAGAGLYLVGHGLVKGSLFLCAGLLLHRLGSVDEHELRGRGRPLRLLGAVCGVAALGLAGFPPYGTYLGKQVMEEAAAAAGWAWVKPVLFLGSAVTGAAVLRLAARVFLGWGSSGGESARSPTQTDRRETQPGGARIPAVMVTIAVALAVLPAGLGLLGGAPSAWADAASTRLLDRPGYADAVLRGRGPGALPAGETTPPSAEALGVSVLTAATAAGLALAALFSDRWPKRLRRSSASVAETIMRPLRAVHSGHVGDYAMWLVVGVAALGAWLNWPG